MTWKILAVDDDPDILEAVRLILESRGYEVIGARNGLQALEKMKTTLQFLPEDLVELEDIVSLIRLYLGNFNEMQQEKLVSSLQQLIDRFPHDQHNSLIYELMGDLYFKRDQREEALAAYQSAVVCEFDHHEIWDKILISR